MFELNNRMSTFRPEVPSDTYIERNLQVRQHFAARDLFEKALMRGKLYRFWAAVFQRPRWLLDLDALKSKMHAVNAHHSGLRNVPIHQIVGTEHSGGSFDLAFHPTTERSRQRWVGVATASLALIPLPSVELTQIGDAFFVRDGHHRISVARALKQDFIEAEVTTWEYSWKHSRETVANLLAYQMSG
jgi:hypothetical protein